MKEFSREDASSSSTIDIFLYSAPADREYQQQLERHLSLLQRNGRIRLWHHGNIKPGEARKQVTLAHLNTAQIVLLLISPDFATSLDCNEVMNKALERQKRKQTYIIPIIVSPVVGWQDEALGDLQASPKRGTSLRSGPWRNLDEAFFEVAEDILHVIDEVITQPSILAPRSNQVQESAFGIHDFSLYITEKVQSFVGRKFLFREIQEFIDTNPRGYFLLYGDPGIGKSAIAAKLVKDRGYVHFFNIRAEGINKARDFLRSICAQLIAVYNLDYPSLPPEAVQDAGFLKRLLNEVAEKTGQKGKCVIVVDALDEAEDLNPQSGSNILFLPTVLPQGIYIIATSRRETEEKIRLRIDIPEQMKRYLIQDEPGNSADITEYIQVHVSNPGIQAYILRHQIDDELFVDYLAEKTQGNFMYLYHVLPEIERGYYQDLALDQIPRGLESYYNDHWRRIKQANPLDWFDYRLPVIQALTVVKKPISVTLIMKYSEVHDKRRVNEVLHDFDQFLYKVDMEYDRQRTTCYRWYHESFFDFISRKEEVAEELVDLRKANEKVANEMWAGWAALMGDTPISKPIQE